MPAGCWPGWGGRAAAAALRSACRGSGGRPAISPLTFFLWSLSGWEGAESGGCRGKGGLSKEALEEKGETPGPWISNCLSREVSLYTTSAFREERTQGRGKDGAWREGQRAHICEGLGSWRREVKQWPEACITDKRSVTLGSHPRCVTYRLYGLSGSWVSLREAARENGKVARCRTGCSANTEHWINMG